MTFWEHFLRLLRHKPTPALAALYWHVTRRRVRARNRLRVASADLPFAYAVWIGINEPTSEPQTDWTGLMKQWAWRPHFSIIVHSTTERAKWRQSIASVERQVYPYWTLVESSGSSINASLDHANGDFVVPVCAGDMLSEFALFRFAESLQTAPDAGILYGDEDRIDDRGRRTRPWFKPRWNEELFLALDYLSHAVAIRTKLARRAAKEAKNLGDLLLTACFATDRPVVHVPHILWHVAAPADNQMQRLAAVAHHLESAGGTCAAGPFGTIRVKWPLPEELPLVSLIIPTKDKLDVLQPCLESLLKRTDYENVEILIVDNGSVEVRTIRFLEQIKLCPKVRVLSYGRPFNYSAINNHAVRAARGSYLCLLNNDTEALEPAWLTELMRYAARPEIGAAGAKLLYEDGSIQHAGVVVGIGEAAGHPHRFLPSSQPGYFGMPHASQFVSAVTGACLVVEKKKFEAVGGLDEDKLAIAFNDVDLCLKLEAMGWRNVYVPHAVLVHHESKSRRPDMSPKEVNRYRRELAVLQERWGTKTYDDPLHNPNLDRYSETFVFRL